MPRHVRRTSSRVVRAMAIGWLAAGLLACRPPAREAGAPAADDPDAFGLGFEPPADTPVVFAPGVVSRDGRFEQFLHVSADARTLVFGVTNDDWRAFSLHTMSRTDGGWSEPVGAPFVAGGLGAFTAAPSADGSVVFFAATRPDNQPPADIYVSRRSGTEWSAPERVPEPVSSPGNEFEVAMSDRGTLFFSSSRPGGLGDLDLYRAVRVDGEYRRAESLGAVVNSGSGDDLPYIAPDESYLIFASDRPGGLGLRDLYITFATGGGWSEPRNLGAPINSEFWDIYPHVTADGRYLFFTRRRAWRAGEDSDILWVRADFIEELRPPG